MPTNAYFGDLFVSPVFTFTTHNLQAMSVPLPSFFILNGVRLPDFKQSWIITSMNVKIRIWTLYSIKQVFFFPKGTCSNIKFISCSRSCNMLYLEWPYRSTSCALRSFCWHETGNLSSSSFSQHVLWVLSIGCSGLVPFLFPPPPLDLDWYTVLENSRSTLSSPCL